MKRAKSLSANEASVQGVNSWLEEAYNMRLRGILARPVAGVGE